MKNKTIYIAAAVCLAAVIGMVLALTLTGGRRQTAAFTPPPFDAAAQTGTPAAPDASWTQVHREGMDFSSHTAASPFSAAAPQGWILPMMPAMRSG